MSSVADPPQRPDDQRAGSHPDGSAPDPERVTEIGGPELIDRARHPIATVVGVALLVVVVVLGVIGLATVIDDEEDVEPVPRVVVPRLTSRTMIQAQSELERLGLIVDVRFEPNEVVPPDVVVDQEPIAGARLDVGEQVVLVVSDGPMGVLVPDLAGAQVGEADRTLGVIGLQISLRQLNHETVPMGEIIRSDPSAGSRAAPGSTVVVAVSAGPEHRTVPEVVGMPSHEAFAAIGRADLEIAGVTERRVGDDEAGSVLSTDPAAGARVPRDQPISVVVGSASGPIDTPDVVGLTESFARAVLSNVGLDSRVRTEAVPSGDRRVGRVMRQSRIAGTPSAAGDTVTLFVGVAAAPSPPTGPPRGDAPATTSPP